MDPFGYFRAEILRCLNALIAAGLLPAGLELSRVTVTPPRDPDHGDVASNAALVLARSAEMAPLALAGLLADELRRHDWVIAVRVAAPGFVDLRLSEGFWHDRLREILAADGARRHRVAIEIASTEPDLSRIREHCQADPAFHVQFAHARAQSVLLHAATALPGVALSGGALAGAELRRLTDSAESRLIRLLARGPGLIESAAESHEAPRIAFYLYDVASAFHGLWNTGSRDDASLRFIVAGEREATLARLALVRSVAQVIASGLGMLGVEPVEEMR